VGIVWSGSVTFKGNAYRAAGLEHFLRFATVPGVQLFSMQKGPPHEELKKLSLNSLVTDLSPLLLDFESTAAALGMLDMVIMTDSATAHLGGARPAGVGAARQSSVLVMGQRRKHAVVSEYAAVPATRGG